MPDLLSLYSITFAILVFLTSKYSQYLEQSYDIVSSNLEDRIKGESSARDSILIGGAISRLVGSGFLMSGFLLNGYLLYSEIPKSALNYPLLALAAIIGGMIFMLFFRRLLQIWFMIGIIKSKKFRTYSVPKIIDIDEEKIEEIEAM